MAVRAPAALDQHTAARVGAALIVGIAVVGELVGQPVGLPVGRGGVEEDQIDLEVQQRRDREEDALLQPRQHVHEDIHGAIARVLVDFAQPGDVGALGHPPAAGQLAQRPDRQPVGDHREARPLHRLGVQPPPADRRDERAVDAQPLPQLVGQPAGAQRARLDHADLPGHRGGDGVGRVQEAADRLHQPPQRLAVDLIGAAEAVHDLRARHARLGVALVVRQRQVAELAAIRVAALRLAQVHGPTTLAPSPLLIKPNGATRVPT